MAVRITTTGQTTFVKKVVIGTPVRSVTGSGAAFTSLNDVTITNKSEKQIIVFDSDQQKFINTDSATLVNLTVSGDILPAADSSSDLGSPTKKFKDLYLSGDTIVLGSIRLRDSDGGLGVVDPTTRAPKPLNMRGSIAQIRKFFSAAGDLSYNPNTGVFAIDVETVYTKANFDSDLGAALAGGAGITYDSSSDTISLTNTSVTPGTYGSASQVPQIVVNTKGQITNASNVSIAGVTGVTFDSSNGALTVSTSAGSNFTDSINLNPFSTSNLSEGSNLYFTSGRADARVNAGFSAKSTTNLSEGNNLYYTTARADSAFDARFDSSFDERLGTKSTANLSEGSNLYFTTGRADARVNLQTGSNLDLSSKSTSNLSEGTNLYFTTARADSDAKNAISGGTGIGYNSTTGVITSNDGQIVHDNLSGFVADEHVAHSGVSITAGAGLTGGGDISSTRTLDIVGGKGIKANADDIQVDSANLVILARNALSGSNGITYSTSTGDIRAPQPLDSAANPTFNQLRGPATFIIDPATIGDATGTLRVLGNLTVDGTTTTINSTNVSVNDKTFTIADSAADSSGLAGAGIIWGGSSITANKPSFKYNHASERFDANRTINATSFIGNVTGNASGTAATVTNAAQTNITSLGTLTGLTSTGDVAVDSAGGFLFDVSEKELKFGDNYQASFGTGGDLNISHNGTSTAIANETGDLRITNKANDADVVIKTDDGSGGTATYFLADGSTGAAELYHYGSKKLATTSSGATVTGTLVADGLDIAKDTDASAEIGRAHIGNMGFSDLAGFSHVDRNSTTGYALVQNSVGQTFLNGLGSVGLLIGNSNIAFVTDSGFNINTGKVLKFEGSTPDTNELTLTVTDPTDDRTITLPDANGTVILNTGGTFTDDVAIDSAGGFLFDVSDQALEFGDNYEAVFGAGTDLRIFHDGTNSNIINTTGSLIIADTNGDVKIQGKYGEQSIVANNDGSVELYYDNSKKLETTSSGVTVTGQLATGQAVLRDWSSSDTDIDALLEGSNFGNIIEGRINAHLVLGIRNNDTTDGVSIISSDSDFNTHSVYNNHVVSFKADGDIEIDSAGAILYDKSEKILKFGDNYKAVFGAGSDLSIRHSGSHSIISDAGTGDLLIAGSQVRIMSSNISENMIRAITDGAVELYHDNSKKLETTSSGVSITGTASATTFSGSGSDLTNLPAGQLTGTIDSARLPTGTFGGGGGSSLSNIADSSGGVVITGDIKEKSTDSGAGLLLLQTNNTILSSGDSVGAIHFQAPDEASGGVAANVTGKIENIVSGSMSSTKATTDFSFSLPSGSTNLREVVRFEADGDIKMQGDQILMQTGSYFAVLTRATLSGTRFYTLPDATGTIITTGNSNTPASTTSASNVDFVLVDDGGTMKRISRFNLGISVTSSSSTNSTSQTAIYTASKTTYGAAKLLVTAVSSSERHITEIYLTHDGTTAVATEYGTVTTNGILATYDVDISGSNFRLLATPASSTSTTFKVKPTLIEA